MKTLLQVDNISLKYSIRKSYFGRQEVEVLKGLSFELMEGECLGVIGRNGSGKSTLLKVLADIIEPDSGKILRNTSSITLLNLQAGFDRELSGRYNVIMNGMLVGFSKKEILKILPEIFEFSELGNAFDQPIKTYSSGMLARLGFSTALKLEPDILLIDEVLAVGDVEFRKKSLEAMKKKLLSDQTVILVAHQAPILKELCDRVIWIENGVAQMEGDASEVITAYEHYIIENPPGS